MMCYSLYANPDDPKFSSSRDDLSIVCLSFGIEIVILNTVDLTISYQLFLTVHGSSQSGNHDRVFALRTSHRYLGKDSRSNSSSY